MRSWTSEDPESTRRIGATLAEELGGDGVVLLIGDLGTGKTVLTQGMATALGIAVDEVQSPTFTLVREHSGSGGRLTHIDLYRLDPDDLPSLGLEELLAGESLTVIEWAERLPWSVPADLVLELARTGVQGQRLIREVESPQGGVSDGGHRA